MWKFVGDYYDAYHVLTYVVEHALVVDYLFGTCDMSLIAFFITYVVF